MIKDLIQILKGVGFDPRPEEVADILWLASHLDASKSSEKMAETEPLQKPLKSDADMAGSNAGEQEDQDKRNGRHSQAAKARAEVYPAEPEGKELAGPGDSGLPFRSPAAMALPGQLAIGKALRPLMRKVASRCDASHRISATSSGLGSNPTPFKI